MANNDSFPRGRENDWWLFSAREVRRCIVGFFIGGILIGFGLRGLLP